MVIQCRRNLSESEHAESIVEESTGSIEVSSSQNITVLGVIIRRLFKTTSEDLVDFDLPLAATISIEDDQGVKLGSLEIDETFKPSKELYEILKSALRKAANKFYNRDAISMTEATSHGIIRTIFPMITREESSEMEVELIKSTYDDSSFLINPLSSDRCDELLTIPMSIGHWGEYNFPSGLPLHADRSYVITVTIHRRGWYKFLQRDEETIKSERVEIKFGPKKDSHIVNSVLNGITFVQNE
jgi:hypothetical protein